jgi:hypothetical protein
MMETESSHVTSVNFYETAQRIILEGSLLRQFF